MDKEVESNENYMDNYFELANYVQGLGSISENNVKFEAAIQEEVYNRKL
jgi:hypothetical protein